MKKACEGEEVQAQEFSTLVQAGSDRVLRKILESLEE
jgi:hypothetical protein